MTKVFVRIWVLLCLLPLLACASSGGATVKLHHMTVNLSDQASLQRGAQTYMNYCAGCHSLQFMRYNRLAKDIGIVDSHNQVDVQMVEKNLIFTGDKVFDTVQIGMDRKQAKQWFGVEPPDLSLRARVRGTDWLYNYLLGFYNDSTRPWGVNNVVFPDVAMPNVLASLQGEYEPVYRTETRHVGGKDVQIKSIDHLNLKTFGSLGSIEFDATVRDLVNFLAYVGEPARLHRERIGPWVLIFLLIFTVLALLLKKAYWKDIK